MTEENRFKPIDTISIYDDGIGKVILYDSSHANESEAQRIHTITTIASLAYGNEFAKNPEALYERMKSIKHESLWEFIRIGDNANTLINDSMRMFISNYPTSNMHLDHQQNIACFRIKVPLFVRAQFMRHRSFSYLEMSRRYTKDAKIPFEFWYAQDMPSDFKKELESQWIGMYKAFVQEGLHTQVASRFLPQTTYTEFYMMGEVEGLRNFFRLRLDEHAQAEIRKVAEAMIKLLDIYQPELASKCRGT